MNTKTLVEMFNAALNWVTMILDTPSVITVVFGVPSKVGFSEVLSIKFFGAINPLLGQRVIL